MGTASKTRLRKSGRRVAKRAGMEIEVKLRIADQRQFLRQLKGLKAKPIRPRVHEMNTLYDTPEGQLARKGQMLRIRVERPAARADSAPNMRRIAGENSGISALLTFKGPVARARANEPGRYKIREEHEVRISEHEEMHKILEALGLRPSFRYEKFRSTFTLPGMTQLKLTLDETPIGVFVELEGERREIDRAARMLGFDRSDYINKSYGELLLEQRGLAARTEGIDGHPFSGLGDMLFAS
jgi:adenylate cyclase class 2